MITLTQLNYFVTIAQEGSFVKAADVLGVSQPALTAQIMNLEDQVSVMLLDRTKKPIVPTEVGKKIMEQALLIMNETAKIKDIAHSLTLQMSDSLHLGIIPTVSPYLLPIFLPKFNQNLPDTSLTVSEMLTEDVVYSVKSGKIDAGIISTPIDVKNVVTMPLYEERIFLYCSNQHPLFGFPVVPVEELNRYPIWFLREGNCFKNQVMDLCTPKRNGKVKFTFESNSIDSLIKIVDTQEGVTFIPELAAKSLPKTKQDNVRTIEAMNPGREISLVVSKAFLKKLLIKKVMAIVTDALPKDIAKSGELDLMNTHINL